MSSLIDAAALAGSSNKEPRLRIRNNVTGEVGIPNEIHYLNILKRALNDKVIEKLVTQDYHYPVCKEIEKEPVRKTFLKWPIDNWPNDPDDKFVMGACSHFMYNDLYEEIKCPGVYGPAEYFMTEQSLLISENNAKFGAMPFIKLCWVDIPDVDVTPQEGIYNAFVCAGYEDYYDDISIISKDVYEVIEISDED